MNIKDLIKRSLAGEELSAEERTALENFDPDHDSGELQNIKAEFSALQERHLELQRSCRIEKIAGETGCTDPGYFDYLARKHDIDLDDREAVMKFASEVAENSPGCFQARITPGPAGNPSRHPGNSGGDTLNTDRIDRIINSLNSASAENL